MNDLFSEDPSFRRAQYTKLSDNVKEWPEEIAALVSEHLPTDMGLDVSVQFQKVDEQKGYALGTAIVRHPQAPKQVGIPVIVKSWHVTPFDMFFQEGKLHWMTDDALARAFFSANVGAGLASPKPPPSMQDDQGFENRFPPIGGKYASVAAAIMPTRLDGDISELHDIIKRNPELLGKYAAHGMTETFTKWAKKNETAQDELDTKRATRIMSVKKNGPDDYHVFASKDEAFDPVLVRTDRMGLRHLLEMRKVHFGDAGDPMGNIDRNGETTIVAPESPYGKPVEGTKGGGVDGSGSYGAELGKHINPFVFDPLQDDRTVVQCSSFGRYGVRDKNGVLAKGWVLPNVVEFSGRQAGMKIFVGAALAAMQSRIAGIPLNDEPNIQLPVDKMESGKMGVLIYTDGKKSMSTVPFQILNVTIYQGERSIAIVDYKGNKINLIPSPRADGIMPISDSKVLGPLLGPGKNYLISAQMTFIRFPKLTSVSESDEDFKKIAHEHYLDALPLKVSAANGRYVFRGGQLAKYAGILGNVVRKSRGIGSQVALKAADGQRQIKAMVQKVAFDLQSLDRLEAAFLLANFGLGQEKIAEVLDRASKSIVLEVHHLRYPDVGGQVKTASVLERYARQLRPPIAELVKLAAMLEDSDSVDTVLSLGFMNSENIQRFSAIRPMLEEVSGVLSKLLLAARLGMEDIPEEAARAAVQHLQKVIDGLAKLQMLGNQEKTSSAPVKQSMTG